MKPSRRVALLALPVWFLAAAVCAQGSSRTFFLVARPGLPDPNFRESVVLVTQDERAQATGVIINRPTDRSLAELLPGERFKSFTEPIFFGGPVALQGLFAVFRADQLPGEAVTMLPGLYLALQPDTIDALLNSPPRSIRFFAGYSGWAPGQLRGEIDRGDWLAVEADADTVFLKDTSRLWQDMVQRARAVRADAGLPYTLHLIARETPMAPEESPCCRNSAHHLASRSNHGDIDVGRAVVIGGREAQ